MFFLAHNYVMSGILCTPLCIPTIGLRFHMIFTLIIMFAVVGGTKLVSCKKQKMG